jgi:hypothetical protein
LFGGHCLLETQYAFQEQTDMVPLMMQEGIVQRAGWE